jgi:hypothetical protein
MADSKITALSDGGIPQSTDEFVVARSTSNKKIAGSNMPGFEFDYVQITSNVTPTATTSATANSVIDGNAVSYDGSTRIKIEFWSGSVGDTGAAQNLLFTLYDGSTELGSMGQLDSVSGGFAIAIYLVVFLTPSNASHTYHIKAWKASGSPVIRAGNGAAGNNSPAWYRITKA